MFDRFPTLTDNRLSLFIDFYLLSIRNFDRVPRLLPITDFDGLPTSRYSTDSFFFSQSAHTFISLLLPSPPPPAFPSALPSLEIGGMLEGRPAYGVERPPKGFAEGGGGAGTDVARGRRGRWVGSGRWRGTRANRCLFGLDSRAPGLLASARGFGGYEPGMCDGCLVSYAFVFSFFLGGGRLW